MNDKIKQKYTVSVYQLHNLHCVWIPVLHKNAAPQVLPVFCLESKYLSSLGEKNNILPISSKWQFPLDCVPCGCSFCTHDISLAHLCLPVVPNKGSTLGKCLHRRSPQHCLLSKSLYAQEASFPPPQCLGAHPPSLFPGCARPLQVFM